MKTIIHEDCGNSPKNILVQDVTIALAKRDVKFILNCMTDDIPWNRIGNVSMHGKGPLADALKSAEKAAELAVYHVATHGKAGAVNGRLKMSNGRVFDFRHVYEFGNTKGTVIQEITSYVIENKKVPG